MWTHVYKLFMNINICIYACVCYLFPGVWVVLQVLFRVICMLLNDRLSISTQELHVELIDRCMKLAFLIPTHNNCYNTNNCCWKKMQIPSFISSSQLTSPQWLSQAETCPAVGPTDPLPSGPHAAPEKTTWGKDAQRLYQTEYMTFCSPWRTDKPMSCSYLIQIQSHIKIQIINHIYI